MFCFQDLHDKCNASEAKLTDHIKRQKEAEDVTLKRLLDRLQNDRGVLTEQKTLLLKESEDGLTQINGFLTEDLKTDLPTGIWRGKISPADFRGSQKKKEQLPQISFEIQ